jgi:hypothetical protein
MEAWLGKQSSELYIIYVCVPTTATCSKSRFFVRYVPTSVAHSLVENYPVVLET